MPYKSFCSAALIAALTLAGTLNLAQAGDTHSHDKNEDALHALSHLFDDAALANAPKLVDCTLSGGEKTQCYAITVKGSPADHDTGPWCPTNIADGREKGGIWLESGKVHDVDGTFIKNLATFYDDAVWQLYDEATGKIRVTDTKRACQMAARPNVAAEFNNYCVQCELSYMETSTEQTYVLPITPIAARRPIPVRGQGGTGVALNGVRIDAPAPVDAILSAHTLAPFDDCGGHINLHVGYHYHALTGCSKEVASITGHAPIIGLAMDGHKLHARLNGDGKEPTDLDECRGHASADIGYHYHANDAGKNAILPCLTAQTGCANAGSETQCDASKRPKRRPPPSE